MSIKTRSMHITPIGGNVFSDLGFGPEEAAALKAESDRRISQKLLIKESLMKEIANWIEAENLKQIDAAQVPGTPGRGSPISSKINRPSSPSIRLWTC